MALPNASIYVTSLEEVPVIVTPPTAVDPTSDVVYMAFLSSPPPAQPQSSDWQTATWLATPVIPYTALCLVGPGGTIQLTAGTWYVWIKISASPEIPVKYCGILEVS